MLIAGPCAVESREQLRETAAAVKAAGAHILRGGAFKPRTSPYAFQGLVLEGLKLLREAVRAGIRTIEGLGMLVHQGAAAFTLWTGRAARCTQCSTRRNTPWRVKMSAPAIIQVEQAGNIYPVFIGDLHSLAWQKGRGVGVIITNSRVGKLHLSRVTKERRLRW